MDKTKRKPQTRNIGLYVSPMLRENLSKLAATEERTLSAYVRIVLEKHVERRLGRRAA